MNVQPWKSQFRAPTSWKQPPKDQKKKPFVNIELEWVHGYLSRTCKKNIAILADGCVAYNAAAVGVVYDQKSHQ